MARGAAPQSGQNDDSLSPIWVSIGLIVLAMAIWYFFSDYIVLITLKIKLGQAYLISLFTEGLNWDIRWMQEVDPKTVRFEELQDVSNVVGSYARFPYAILLGIFAVILSLSKSAKAFRNIYNMKKLAEAEKVNWPQITPVLGLDLIKQDIHEGPWAMALTPMQFAKKHQLVVEQKEKLKNKVVSRKARIKSKLLKGPAAKVFAMQLGAYWTGIAQLNPPTKALFAAFAAKANHDSAACTRLLSQIAKSAAPGVKQLDFRGTDELLKKYFDTRPVQKVLAKHAYVYTVMASLLEAARADGVLATADFLWLKPIERRLWYTLNSVGRQTPFVEVAGIFAHWLAEKEFGSKLYVPVIEQAVNGLEIALQEIVYQVEE